MPLQPVVTEVERLLFRSDVAAAGAFRCSSTHTLFNDSGPASGHLLVFPRTSTKLLFAGGRTVTATPALAIFYNEGQEYRREKIDRTDSSDWFMVAPDVVRDVVARYDASAADREDIFPFASGRAGGRVYLRQRGIHQWLASGAVVDPAVDPVVDRLDGDEAIVNLLDETVREAYGVKRGKPLTTRGERHEIAEQVKGIIAARPAANPSLRSLAAAANCSPYSLCRIFRSETGYTVTEFKHALRLRIALSALRHTRDLTEVALALGYTSHSHFTLYFRRHFGITPSEYRNAA
ncbi:MAG TPA: helix-turn-helix transcriptional regulator [Thermoanaerobaculia bacterium]|jgi:AraC-like DNA-binding protein